MELLKDSLFLVDPPTGTDNTVPTTVLSPTTINTQPTDAIIFSSSSLLKNEPNDDFPQRDLNLNLHHHEHLAQQRVTSNANHRIDNDNDDDDDDDIDDIDETNNQNVNRTITVSNR